MFNRFRNTVVNYELGGQKWKYKDLETALGIGPNTVRDFLTDMREAGELRKEGRRHVLTDTFRAEIERGEA
ncbi:MAG: hypothetical protein CMH23_10530 [Methylophaga sp.]|nr:hypothetical protein [Methylophaga sp.]